MTYTELKKQIKEHRHPDFTLYIASWGDNGTCSNFLDTMPSFEQIVRAEEEGLLVRDFDTWVVN